MTLRCLFLVVLVCTATARADDRPVVGLVLGGGGAKGAAHIGAIEVLEELGVPVDLVVGTSMGAIVGGLYAAGYDADGIRTVLAAIDWNEVLRDQPERALRPMRRKSEDLDLSVRYSVGLKTSGIATPAGVLYGQQLDLLLRRTLQPVHDVHDFDRLPIPFRAVATDMATGDPVVIGDGDLALALRASMSVPGAFAPVRRDGQVLVDGGVVNNVPVDVARALGADVVIAVDVGSDLPDPDTLRSALAVTLATSQIMSNNSTRDVLATLEDQDIYVRVDLGTITTADFDRAVEAIPRGNEAMRTVVDRLRPLAVSPGAYRAWRTARTLPRPAPPTVVAIEVDPRGAPAATQMVAARVRQTIGEPFDPIRLEEDLDRLYGIGRFALIDYELVPVEGGVRLVLRPLDKPWGPTYLRFGLGFEDDFAGGRRYRMSVETLTHGLGEKGRELRVRGQVGEPTGLRLELYEPLDLRDRWFARAAVRATQTEFILRGGVAGTTTFIGDVGDRLGAAVISEVAGELSLGRNLGETWEVAVTSVLGHAWLEGSSGLGLSVRDDESVGRGVVSLTHDSLDDFALPSRGRRLAVRFDAAVEALGAVADNSRLEWEWDEAIGFGRRRFLLGVSGASVAQPSRALGDESLLGGLFRLSGYRRDELIGDDFVLARLVYFDTAGGGDTSVFGIPVVVGASVEYGDTWFDGEPWRLDDLLWSGSVFAGFDTLLGSIYLGYGRGEEGRDSVYFSFGPLFRIGRGSGFDAF